jgi:hypothetical protein
MSYKLGRFSMRKQFCHSKEKTRQKRKKLQFASIGDKTVHFHFLQKKKSRENSKTESAEQQNVENQVPVDPVVLVLVWLKSRLGFIESSIRLGNVAFFFHSISSQRFADGPRRKKEPRETREMTLWYRFPIERLTDTHSRARVFPFHSSSSLFQLHMTVGSEFMLFSAACCLRNSSLCLPSILPCCLLAKTSFFSLVHFAAFVSRSGSSIRISSSPSCSFCLYHAEGSFVATQKLIVERLPRL